MSRKYFGTDGVRGTVGQGPITPDFVMRLGYAAGRVLAETDGLPGGERPAVLIGKDTRISGYMLESALEAGLSAAGVDVLLLGPMPTPGVAYLTRALRAQAGIVISASHNPFEDNGIKFFSGAGLKLSDEMEHAIEAHLDQPLVTMPSASLGKARRINDAAGRYIEFCKSTFPSELDLRGMKIVVDCAHGATYHVAPHVFHELGAEVLQMGTHPDGLNINLGCGSTQPAALQAAVLEKGADLGIAFDGDGDRLVMVDAKGKLHDGDRILYVIAKHRHRAGTLKGGVVGTLMTNLALEHALRGLNIPFERAKVGDRYVLEKLQQQGWQLGGENSGHILCLDKHTSGDGIISALQALHALRAHGASLEECGRELELYPQVLINVRLARPLDLAACTPVQDAVARAEADLGSTGRVLLRPSGTEPVLRVMVEGRDGAALGRGSRGDSAAGGGLNRLLKAVKKGALGRPLFIRRFADSSHGLAGFQAGGAGLGAVAALGVLLGVLAALFLAVLAHVRGNPGHLGQVGRLGAGELLQGRAHGQHLVHTLGTGGHFLVSLAQELETMVQAGLTLLHALRGGVDEALVGCLAMVVAVHMVLGVGEGRAGRGGESQGARAQHHVSAVHGVSSLGGSWGYSTAGAGGKDNGGKPRRRVRGRRLSPPRPCLRRSVNRSDR